MNSGERASEVREKSCSEAYFIRIFTIEILVCEVL